VERERLVVIGCHRPQSGCGSRTSSPAADAAAAWTTTEATDAAVTGEATLELGPRPIDRERKVCRQRVELELLVRKRCPPSHNAKEKVVNFSPSTADIREEGDPQPQPWIPLRAAPPWVALASAHV